MPLLLTLLFMLIPAEALAKPQKLDAAYQGEELLLVESRPFEYDDYKYIRTHGYDLTKPLYNIYWNPKNNQYYYAKAGSLLVKTNGLTYKLNSAKTNATLVYHPRAKYRKLVGSRYIEVTNKAEIQKNYARNLQPDLAFAGWVSSSQRLYIHTKTKEQYLKILSPIDDEGIIPVVPNFSNGGYIDYEIIERDEYHTRTMDGTFDFSDGE